MPFQLSDIVPWGRSYDEYIDMFSLSQADLNGSILGCGDGPASFNAVGTKRGYRIVSADPIYQFSRTELQSRIEEARESITEQLQKNADEFLWTRFRTVDELMAARMEAMRAFLDDYAPGKSEGRYVNAFISTLPFADQAFDLALCSHFLFLYSEQHSADFHVQAILELCRVAREVRIFPLLEFGAVPSRHLDTVSHAIERHGYRAERIHVPYEFQVGGNQMLRFRNC